MWNITRNIQNSLEKIVHDVSVIWLIALRHKANSKDDDGIQSIAIVTCEKGEPCLIAATGRHLKVSLHFYSY